MYHSGILIVYLSGTGVSRLHFFFPMIPLVLEGLCMLPALGAAVAHLVLARVILGISMLFVVQVCAVLFGHPVPRW